MGSSTAMKKKHPHPRRNASEQKIYSKDVVGRNLPSAFQNVIVLWINETPQSSELSAWQFLLEQNYFDSVAAAINLGIQI